MKSLEKFGLTKRESDIYTLLLRCGESSISSVRKQLGAHPQVVYRAIDSLKEKGLVVDFKRKSRRYVLAESPKKLERIQKRRLQEIQEMLPDLQALQAEKGAVVQVHKGVASLQAIRLRAIEELKNSETLYIIGGSGDRYYEAMGEAHTKIEKKRIKKGVRRKLISFEGEREKLQEDTLRKFSEFRYLDDSVPVTSSTNIFANTLVIIIWAEEPILITIEDANVAESYKKYFDQLWKLARQ